MTTAPATPAVAIYSTPPPAGYRYVTVGGAVVLEPIPVPAPAATPVAAAVTPTTTAIHGVRTTPFPAPPATGDSTMRDVVITIAAALFAIFMGVLIYNNWGGAPARNGGIGIIGNGTTATPGAFTPRSGQAPIATEFDTPRGFGARDYKHNCPGSMKPVVTNRCKPGAGGLVHCDIECR